MWQTNQRNTFTSCGHSHWVGHIFLVRKQNKTWPALTPKENNWHFCWFVLEREKKRQTVTKHCSTNTPTYTMFKELNKLNKEQCGESMHNTTINTEQLDKLECYHCVYLKSKFNPIVLIFDWSHANQYFFFYTVSIVWLNCPFNWSHLNRRIKQKWWMH